MFQKSSVLALLGSTMSGKAGSSATLLSDRDLFDVWLFVFVVLIFFDLDAQ